MGRNPPALAAARARRLGPAGRHGAIACPSSGSHGPVPLEGGWSGHVPATAGDGRPSSAGTTRRAARRRRGRAGCGRPGPGAGGSVYAPPCGDVVRRGSVATRRSPLDEPAWRRSVPTWGSLHRRLSHAWRVCSWTLTSRYRRSGSPAHVGRGAPVSGGWTDDEVAGWAWARTPSRPRLGHTSFVHSATRRTSSWTQRGRVAAVLDWEFAQWHPDTDLGTVRLDTAVLPVEAVVTTCAERWARTLGRTGPTRRAPGATPRPAAATTPSPTGRTTERAPLPAPATHATTAR